MIPITVGHKFCVIASFPPDCHSHVGWVCLVSVQLSHRNHLRRNPPSFTGECVVHGSPLHPLLLSLLLCSFLSSHCIALHCILPGRLLDCSNASVACLGCLANASPRHVPSPAGGSGTASSIFLVDVSCQQRRFTINRLVQWGAVSAS